MFMMNLIYSQILLKELQDLTPNTGVVSYLSYHRSIYYIIIQPIILTKMKSMALRLKKMTTSLAHTKILHNLEYNILIGLKLIMGNQFGFLVVT